MKLSPDWSALSVEIKPRQGLCSHPPTYTISEAWFRNSIEDFSLWFTVGGREWIEHESGERHLLQRGSCFLVRPHAAWNCLPAESSSEDWTMIYIHFKVLHAGSGMAIDPSLLAPMPTVIHSYHADYFEEVCRRILHRGYKWLQRDPPTIIDGPAYRSSCALLKALLQDICADDSPAETRDTPMIPPWHYAKLIRLMNAIQADPKQFSGIAEMAAALNVSDDYFRRIFRRTFGKSPLEALTHARIERAAMMLKSTDAPVATIAIESGYDNTHYFSRIFKQEMSVTPSEYRRGGRRRY